MRVEKLINLGLEVVELEMNNGSRRDVKKVEREINTIIMKNKKINKTERGRRK